MRHPIDLLHVSGRVIPCLCTGDVEEIAQVFCLWHLHIAIGRESIKVKAREGCAFFRAGVGLVKQFCNISELSFGDLASDVAAE